MCKEWLKTLFQKEPELVIPYPKEAEVPGRTVENTDIYSIIAEFLAEYNVPEQWWSFWDGIREKPNEVLTIAEEYPWGYAGVAGTVSEALEFRVKPSWASPGVVAHEYAHISYYLLPSSKKIEFEPLFDKYRKEDKLMKLAYDTFPYMRSNYIEGHADTYRYLGDRMPDELKQFYPRLLR